MSALSLSSGGRSFSFVIIRSIFSLRFISSMA
nr:MAG TPA: hypothetical protein [Caudoviricetes sp.]